MKQFFTLVFALLLSTSIFAQTDAVDFTVTDLDGNEHNLFSILDEGKVVVLDCSATWCPPCWGFHGEHYLQDIHEKYGPDGTDQVRVIFYEADASTSLEDLQGTGGNTLGNWLEGSTYPYINEAPISLSGSVYWPLGFPTINVIDPTSKQIIADLYDPWVAGGGLAAMEEIIEGAFPTTSSTEALEEINVSVYPNPFTENVTIDLTNADFDFTSIQVLDITGNLVQEVRVDNQNIISINTGDFTSGVYLINVLNSNEIVGTKKITK